MRTRFHSALMLFVLGALPITAHAQFKYLGTELLDSPYAHPAVVADSADRPGYNGRLHVAPPIRGSGGDFPVLESGDPGAAAYGAYGQEGRRVYVRVGHVQVSFSPWQRFDKHGLQHLERARNEWLRREGYVGGVRTFVNDGVLFPAGPDSDRADPSADDAEEDHAEPRRDARPVPAAVIPVPEGVKRERPRFQADASPLLESVTRISIPSTATPAHITAHAQEILRRQDPAQQVADSGAGNQGPADPGGDEASGGDRTRGAEQS